MPHTPDGFRRCTGKFSCGKIKALNPDNFQWSSTKRYYWRRCKTCSNARRMELRRINLTKRAGSNDKCNLCQKPMDGPYKGRYICSDHTHGHQCKYCEFEDDCRKRINSHSNMMCEERTDFDLVCEWLRAEGLR